MKKKYAKNLVELFKNDYDIYYLADTDDYFVQVAANDIDEDNLTMSFEIVDFYISLEDNKYNINNFKVYKKPKTCGNYKLWGRNGFDMYGETRDALRGQVDVTTLKTLPN